MAPNKNLYLYKVLIYYNHLWIELAVLLGPVEHYPLYPQDGASAILPEMTMVDNSNE